jgi:malonate transporter
MDIDIALRTVTPILTLMGLGYLSRKVNILKHGDERVLNSYIYFFALPSLFLTDLSEMVLTRGSLGFVAAGILPILVSLIILGIGYLLKAYSSDTFSLVAIAAIFGSTAFFGIPFVVFAFPTAEGLATLSAATIAIVSVPISIAILEFRSLEKGTKRESIRRICGRFARNPLILSILVGFSLSLSGARIPDPLSTSLHMVGLTTAPVAIFVLGVFLYGKKYVRVRWALVLSLLRAAVLPAVALLLASLFGLGVQERVTVVLMSSTPLAVSMIVLSQRYDFHREMISSLLLVSSLAAGLYMNLWLYLV